MKARHNAHSVAAQTLAMWVLPVVACYIFIGSVHEVGAQSGANQQHTENRADQAQRGNFRVDPSTLGMSVSIPLASYPGRAGLNVPVTLNFNSKVWSIDYEYTVPGQLFTYTWTKAKYAETSTAGWTTSLDAPYIEYTGRNQYYNSSGDAVCDFCEPEPYGIFYIKRIHVHLPDGSAHELRADDTAHPFEGGPGDFTGIFKAVDSSRMYFDTVSDQGTGSRSSRRSETDALGRLTEVVEFTRTLSNPTVAENPLSGDYVTSYKYDVLGNLRRVAQGVQSRFFMYDSLSRLIRAKNPEQGNLTPDADFPAQTDSTSGASNSSWSMAYNYDNNGNLHKRKDARNITATHTYDALNRNTFVNYSDTATDPDLTRIYDTATNGKGRLRESYSGGNETLGTNVEHTRVHGYDSVGRPLDQRQRFKSSGAWTTEYQIQRELQSRG